MHLLHVSVRIAFLFSTITMQWFTVILSTSLAFIKRFFRTFRMRPKNE